MAVIVDTSVTVERRHAMQRTFAACYGTAWQEELTAESLRTVPLGHAAHTLICCIAVPQRWIMTESPSQKLDVAWECWCTAFPRGERLAWCFGTNEDGCPYASYKEGHWCTIGPYGREGGALAMTICRALLYQAWLLATAVENDNGLAA